MFIFISMLKLNCIISVYECLCNEVFALFKTTGFGKWEIFISKLILNHFQADCWVRENCNVLNVRIIAMEFIQIVNADGKLAHALNRQMTAHNVLRAQLAFIQMFCVSMEQVCEWICGLYLRTMEKASFTYYHW